MTPHAGHFKHPEQTMLRVAADMRRAVLRSEYCSERSRLTPPRCVDMQDESDAQFGRQLWYFEGEAIDASERRMRVYGALEYSIEFGIVELVEDGIFDAASERERFRDLYFNQTLGPTWNAPVHRWFAAGILLVSIVTLIAALTSLSR
jgi:hypothetical protein